MKLENLKHFILNKLTAELSPKLTYHGVHHTRHVYSNCEKYIARMNISDSDANLLLTAALLHDTGFLFTYDNHEDSSIDYTKELLPDWNYKPVEIHQISGMIAATKIPQQPTNLLEQIIGDSDLDYLGTESFYNISQTLFSELVSFEKVKTEKEWVQLQIRFLQKHKYHTPFAKEFREPVKQKHLQEIMDKLK